MQDWTHAASNRGSSSLYLVRIWAEAAIDGQAQWQGRVIQLGSGRAASFRGWQELIDLLALPVTEGPAEHENQTTDHS